MRRAPQTETLDDVLRQMMQQQQRQQSATRVAAIKPAAAASSPSPEEKQSMMKSIEIGGRIYRWSELNQPAVRRQLLPQVEKMIAEFKRDPARLTALGFTEADVKAAITWTTGQYDGLSEEQLYAALPAPAEAAEGDKNVATKLTPGNSAPAIDPKTAFREMAEQMKKPGMTTALRRREQGLSLDPAQTALIRRHDELDAANSAQHAIENPPVGGWMGRADKYIPTAVRELAKLPPLEQAHAAREMAAALRKDERWTDANHPEHAQACHEMKLLYDGQYMEGGNEAVIKD